jgi:hypothetical protein
MHQPRAFGRLQSRGALHVDDGDRGAEGCRQERSHVRHEHQPQLDCGEPETDLRQPTGAGGDMLLDRSPQRRIVRAVLSKRFGDDEIGVEDVELARDQHEARFVDRGLDGLKRRDDGGRHLGALHVGT